MPDATTSTQPAAAAQGAVPTTTAEDHQSEQRTEYGTYVAAGPIDILGGRAFNTGDPVPVSHVDSGVVDTDLVHKITTKTGRIAAGLEKG